LIVPGGPGTKEVSADAGSGQRPRPARIRKSQRGPSGETRPWPIRALAAIGEYLVPNAHAQSFDTDVLVDDPSPAYFFDDSDDGNLIEPEWLIEADDSPSVMSIIAREATQGGVFRRDIVRLHSEALADSVTIKEFGGLCASSDGSCDLTSAGGTDLVIESNSPAIEWTDSDDAASQKWGIFTDDDRWRVTDRTGGNNEVFTAEAGAIDNAVYLDDERVGLGTSTPSPDSKLHIFESSFPDIRLDDGTDFVEIEWNGNSLGIDDSNSGNSVRPFQIEVIGTPADSFVLDDSGNVGFGIDSPAQPVHVRRSAGAQVFVENTSSTADERIPFRLRNNGKVRFVLENTNAGETWTFDNSGSAFDISRVGTGVPELQVQGNGDVRMDSGEAFAQSFNTVSSRTRKTDFKEVEHEAILDKLSALSVTRWRYKADSSEGEHIGPTAEEFQALFGIGDGKHLNLVDTTGIAFAAIKGLRQETRARISELEAENEALRQQVAEIDRIKRQLRRLQSRLQQR
jgi:hypothetical protein